MTRSSRNRLQRRKQADLRRRFGTPIEVANFDRVAYGAWLRSFGATLEPTTSEYEVARYTPATGEPVRIIWRNAADLLTWDEETAADWQAYDLERAPSWARPKMEYP